MRGYEGAVANPPHKHQDPGASKFAMLGNLASPVVLHPHDKPLVPPGKRAL